MRKACRLDIRDVGEKRAVRIDEQEIEPGGEVRIARGKGVLLAGKALFLLRCEGEGGFFTAGAGFDFHHDQQVAFAQEEVGLREGAPWARGRAIAAREKIEKCYDFSRLAFAVRMEVAPSLQDSAGGVGNRRRGR